MKKITVLYLVFPNMQGLMSRLSKVRLGSHPFFEDAMNRAGSNPTWGVKTEERSIDEWIDGLRGRENRLYLSVTMSPSVRPLWAADMSWEGAITTLASHADKIVLIGQSKQAFLYDGIGNAGRDFDGLLLHDSWMDLNQLYSRMEKILGVIRMDVDFLITKKGLDTLYRNTGVQLHPIQRIPRSNKDTQQIVQNILGNKQSIDAEVVEIHDSLDVHVRRREMIQTLDGGELGFVVCHFNVCGYDAPRDNFRRFIKRFEWMEDHLLIVELAYGDQDFVLTGQAKNLLQLRGDSVMWQKEALTNVGTKILRERGYENVGWLDGDTIFETNYEQWFESIKEGMREQNIIQVFDRVEHKFEEVDLSEPGSLSNYAKSDKPIEKIWKTGLGWVVRGEIWDKLGWYDLGIVGSGDRLLFLASVSDDIAPLIVGSPQFASSAGYTKSYLEWAAKWAKEIDGRFGYLEGVVATSEEHGSHDNRQYYDREIALREAGYDPYEHITRDENGVMQWTDGTPDELKEVLWHFFERRREDGSDIPNNPRPNLRVQKIINPSGPEYIEIEGEEVSTIKAENTMTEIAEKLEPKNLDIRKNRFAPSWNPNYWGLAAGLVAFIVAIKDHFGNNDTKLIELGSASGESGSMFAGSGIFSKVWHIDCWLNEAGKKNKAVCETNLRRYPCSEMIEADMFKIAEDWTEQVDVIYVDAEHTEEAVKRAFDSWDKHLRSGGIWAGHDYNEKVWPGVVKAVNDFFPDAEIRVFEDCSWMVIKP